MAPPDTRVAHRTFPSAPSLDDQGINFCVWNIRRALGEGSRSPGQVCSSAAREGARQLLRLSQPGPGVGPNFESALRFAVELHGDQVRKGGEEVPYLGHLLGVCSLVLEAGGDEEQAIAALLHDAAEDRGGRKTLAVIRQRFGDRVADIVDACTDTFEDPKPPWRERKKELERAAGEGRSGGRGSKA